MAGMGTNHSRMGLIFQEETIHEGEISYFPAFYDLFNSELEISFIMKFHL